MREHELFAAYGFSVDRFGLPEPIGDEQRTKNIARAYEAIDRMGYIKCWKPGCITLIAKQTGRTICRFHARTP